MRHSISERNSLQKSLNLQFINDYNSEGYCTVYRKEWYDFYHEGEIPCDKDYIYVDSYNKFLKEYIHFFYYYNYNYQLCKLSPEIAQSIVFENAKSINLYGINISKFCEPYQTKILYNEDIMFYSSNLIYEKPVYMGAFIKATDYKKLCDKLSPKLINNMLYKEEDCLTVDKNLIDKKIKKILNEII